MCMVHTAPHIAPRTQLVSADDVGRRAPPVRRTQHGRAASPMLAQPHRVAASTLCCIAMRACSGLIMRLGAGSHVALAQPHWRPVPCTHADRAGSTRVRRKAADGAPHLHHRDLREVRAAVSECAPSLAPQPPLPRAFPCASLALTAPASRRSVIEPALPWPPLPEHLGLLRIESIESMSAMCARGPPPIGTALWPCSPAPRR